MTLRTIKSEHLQSIVICPDKKDPEFWEVDIQEWLDLDQLLVQFWSTHSIRPQVIYVAESRGNDLRACVSSLLPELTRRELVDLSRSPRT